MEKRLQRINGDTVLEITQDVPVKTRLSENSLLRQKQYFKDSIARFQALLLSVEDQLSQIYAEKEKTK